ncbi:MAG: metallophosphoesterase [Gordonia sp. (in: high G+C Gram-positive bacteria)]|uniref:metallophosphoesterase n=1 Tax=Gordonia sp. (in: high G+C Gram-positive bacteria) TaxID=84139 RepID=UPI0039E37BAC
MSIVAQVSDLHFNGDPVHRRRARALLDYLHSTAGGGSEIDALIVSGDLADEGTQDEYREAFENIVTDIPTLVLLGNHDDRAAFTTVRDGEASTAPVNSSLVRDGLLVLALDSSIPGRNDGALSPETLEYARAEIAAAGDVDVLVSFHHPPAVIGLPMMDERRLFDTAGLEALIADHPNIVGLAVGHAHTPAATIFAGRPLVIAPGSASTLNLPLEGADVLNQTQGPGLVFHVIDDHRMTSHFRVLSTW